MSKTQKLLAGILFLLVALLLANCIPAVQPANRTVKATPTTINIHEVAFVSLAENTNCAEDRNQLYLIDGQYFFHTTKGWCMDAAYAHTLYGATLQEKLCSLEDSFAGPLSTCEPAFEEIFEIMVQHLDQPDLGLGDGHSVELIFEKDQ